MKAGEVADAAVCLGSSDTLGHARNLMVRHKTRKLVVIEDGRPVGIISAKDVIPKLRAGPLRRRRPVGNLLVSRVMSANPVTMGEGSEVSDVARMMLEKKISSVPITARDGSLAGIVTKEGVLRAFLGEKGKKLKVSELMAKKVFSVSRMHTLSHVKKTLVQEGVGRVVVKEKEIPVGVITAADIMFLDLGDPVAGIRVRRANIFRRKDGALKENVSMTEPVAGDIMTENPVTVFGKDDSAKAAGLMLKHNISGLPVVDSAGLLVGIVTKTDIVRAFLERKAER